jgi:hypothetical protein
MLDPAGGQGLITLMGGVLVGAAFLIRLLPVGQCDKCAHCRFERLQQKAAASLEFCPLCRRPHAPGDGEHDH